MRLIRSDLFRDALVRERRRSDRFERPLVLLLISHRDGVAPESFWGPVVEAVSHVSVDTDVVGWFEDDSVLGLIRPLDHSEAQEAMLTLSGHVRHELEGRLTSAQVATCAVEQHVYSPVDDLIPPAVLEAASRRRNLRRKSRDAAKRALDLAGSAVLLIAFSPVFLCVAVLVKLTSKGPVFFRQQRVGAAGRPFTMLKFRTMHVNADPTVHQQYVEHFIDSSQSPQAGQNVVFKIVADPRVTPLGHFLRRSSLDEFPQFWNVLKGEMSLVGPRPPLPYEVARYKRWHRRRVMEAKPGITGLWQVTGRSRTTFDDMVRLDLRYAKNYSVWTDVKILLATPRAVISGNGAH